MTQRRRAWCLRPRFGSGRRRRTVAPAKNAVTLLNLPRYCGLHFTPAWPAASTKRFHGTVALDPTGVVRDASRIADEVVAEPEGVASRRGSYCKRSLCVLPNR